MSENQETTERRGVPDWIKYLGVALAALIVGAAVASTAVPPEEVEVVVEKTVTEEVPVTPDVCLTALNDADDFAVLSGRGFGVAAKTIRAAANFDIAGLNAQTAKLNSLGNKLDPILDSYVSSRDECRASVS